MRMQLGAKGLRSRDSRGRKGEKANPATEASVEAESVP